MWNVPVASGSGTGSLAFSGEGEGELLSGTASFR